MPLYEFSVVFGAENYEDAQVEADAASRSFSSIESEDLVEVAGEASEPHVGGGPKPKSLKD